MRLASLFSGGKDSTFAIYAARGQGHDIACLLSVRPDSAESHLLHHPNIGWTRLQSEAMGVPQIISGSDGADSETRTLEGMVSRAVDRYCIEGLVHGGIRSSFQKEVFEGICARTGLAPVSPAWGREPRRYMKEMVDSGFRIMVVSVSSGGLDGSWLGRILTGADVESLALLSERHGFNLDFEGGEAETFVVGCPLFSGDITVADSRKTWDGYRGMFEILDARLDTDA